MEISVINLLRSGVRDSNALQQQSGLASSDFSQTITMLEIAGLIRGLGGN